MTMTIVFSAIGGHGYEVEVVRRALIEAGVSVIMGEGTQDCKSITDWSKEKNLVEDEIRRSKERGISRQVIIKANHIPWGG